MLGLIPISDTNPTHRFPLVTVGLIVLNVLALFQTPGLGQDPVGSTVYFVENAPLPCQVEDTCPTTVELGPGGRSIRVPDRSIVSFLGAVIFSTFLHAGILHILGNMLFLWIFGNNVEDYLGHVKYILFYLGGGIAAASAHIVWTLARDTGANVPTVGASGAVAAVMGAYMLLFPRARVNVLVPIFILWTVVQMSAFAVLGLWFLYQFLIGAQELTGAVEVAWMAHVGGFVFGLVAIFLLGGRPHHPRPAWYPEWRY